MSIPWNTLLERWFSCYTLPTFVRTDVNQSMEKEDITEGAEREGGAWTPPEVSKGQGRKGDLGLL